MTYRPEIDGLRALAVLSVLFFHAGFAGFGGGFIGVDVFFVISGFLITQHILQDLAVGKFSLARFYARRARRILPALLVVMLLSIPFAYAWMLPSQYEDFSRSLLAVPLLVANIFFWRESGYYAAEAWEKPLLHSWSLGVEEQFYLLFPLALLLLWRMGGRRLTVYGVVLAALLSLGLCEYASRHAPIANFFLLPTRAWELLAGALCALVRKLSFPESLAILGESMKGTRLDSPRMLCRSRCHNIRGMTNHLLSLLGLVMVLAALGWYSSTMRLPSAWSLMPIAGTALILLYGAQGSLVAQVLSWRVPVAIGRISYSVYLWHYPLFAFAHVRMVGVQDTASMVLLCAATLLLGALTWFAVEQPFRNQQRQCYVGNRAALRLLAIALAMLMGAGAYGYFTHGRLAVWTRFAAPNQVRALQLLEEAEPPRFYDNGACVFMTNVFTPIIAARLESCHRRYGSGIAIIGDSHAINLFFELKPNAEKPPFVVAIAQGGCRPHTPAPNCCYDALQDLLGKNPTMFHNMIYEQAGFHLLMTPHGRDADRAAFSDLPMDATVPDFVPHRAHIHAVREYLSRLAAFGRVTWLGPRIEPLIRENLVVRKGCDYPFHLRPNQEALYHRLDAAIAADTKASPIHYRSQMAMVQLDMARDFISCDTTYWKDGDHYSEQGEQHFGQRVTLPGLLKEAKKP